MTTMTKPLSTAAAAKQWLEAQAVLTSPVVVEAERQAKAAAKVLVAHFIDNPSKKLYRGVVLIEGTSERVDQTLVKAHCGAAYETFRTTTKTRSLRPAQALPAAVVQVGDGPTPPRPGGAALSLVAQAA